MTVEFSFDDFDPDRIGARPEVAPGNYHVEVISLWEHGTKEMSANNGEMIVDFEILAGTRDTEVAKTHREFFSYSANAMQRMLTLAVALKLTTIEELKRLKEQQRNPMIDFQQAVTRQCCIGLKEEEYDGKTRVKAGFRFWALSDRAAKGIPLHAAKLREPLAPPLPSGGDVPFDPSGPAAGGSDDPFGGGADDLFGI